MREHPVIELFQWPTKLKRKVPMELFDLKTPQQIAHWHSRAGGVPIHIRRRSRGGEADAILQSLSRCGMTERATMQTTIDCDAMRSPEGIVELNQFRTRSVHEPMLDGEFLTPHRPAFIKNRVRK